MQAHEQPPLHAVVVRGSKGEGARVKQRYLPVNHQFRQLVGVSAITQITSGNVISQTGVVSNDLFRPIIALSIIQ